jgi:hypothetical protein
MNRHFLEFWGKALLLAAQSQKQMEDLAQWFQGGLGDFRTIPGFLCPPMVSVTPRRTTPIF